MKGERIAIIGAGASGMAAAIQLSLYGIKPVIFERDVPGGLLRNARLVENYPGFPEGISGSELADLFRRQFEKCRPEIKKETVLKLDIEGGEFLVETVMDTYRFDKVILAPGTVPKKPQCSIEADACDLVRSEITGIMDLSGKRIVIAGAGDAAFDYALSLCSGNEVIILNRGEKSKCIDILFKEALENRNIRYIKNIEVCCIKKIPSGIRLECRSNDGNTWIDADIMVFAIGREPATAFISENISSRINELEQSGVLFFVGDVSNGIFRQTAIAAGEGVGSAMRIVKDSGGNAD
ncbi:MAG: NAD(P)/FAD-dependent oxidoreductase [Methanomicrobiaceae archaeon]|nr:NAD(P)/FAD-dependent oxidoreductase [Methanomicrobiaceae archaeon]